MPRYLQVCLWHQDTSLSRPENVVVRQEASLREQDTQVSRPHVSTCSLHPAYFQEVR